MGGFTIFTLLKQGLVAAFLTIALIAPGLGRAQGLIRDAEIERTLDLIARPVLQAAGLNPGSVNVLILNSQRMNAFVAGGNNIFVHTGLLQRLKTIDQVRSVLAHEAGHITGGHLARRNENLRTAKGAAGLGLLIAIASIAAGGRSVAFPIASLTQEAALRNFLSHTRAEEASADQAGLRYMIGAGADPRAIMEVMDLFAGQQILSSSSADPYTLTHPLWSERLRYLEDKIASAPIGKGPSQTEVYWHARMVAKFEGFIDNPQRVIRKYRNDKTEIGSLARAVAYHRLPNIKQSMREIDGLIKLRPNDPFYRELKGQFLLEGGDVNGAIQYYRQAVKLAPTEALILAGLGRSLVAADVAAANTEAISVLEKANARDPAIAAVFRDLATAYARSGQLGRASLATAERFALEGRFRDAQIHANRAIKQLPEGSAGWRQARDILSVANRTLK